MSINKSSHWSKTIFDLIESYEIDGLVPRLVKTNNLISKPIFSENLVLISHLTFSSFSKFVHPCDLDVKKNSLDWGPSFKIWHDTWWDIKNRNKITVDTTGLIPNFLNILGS